MLYSISFKKNETYQLNIVEAESAPEAFRIKKKDSPDADIISARKTTMDDFRPDIPVLYLDTAGTVRHNSRHTREEFGKLIEMSEGLKQAKDNDSFDVDAVFDELENA